MHGGRSRRHCYGVLDAYRLCNGRFKGLDSRSACEVPESITARRSSATSSNVMSGRMMGSTSGPIVLRERGTTRPSSASRPPDDVRRYRSDHRLGLADVSAVAPHVGGASGCVRSRLSNRPIAPSRDESADGGLAAAAEVPRRAWIHR